MELGSACSSSGSALASPVRRYAAIDIGTVTCRLLLAEADGRGGLRVLRREAVITNLGEGVDATGVLKPEAMARVAEQIRRFRAIIDEADEAARAAQAAGAEGAFAPTKIVALATSAARDAQNSDEFARMLEELGVRLSVIPGEREAALSFRGASSCMGGERLLVVDTGGGSTEVIAGVGGSDPEFLHSFNVGCRRVTERFLESDPPAEEELARAREWAHGEMAPWFEELRAAGFSPARMVAVAGTATSIVSVRERMEVYDSERVHLSVVSASDLDRVYGELKAVPLEERKRIVGLDPKRANVIVAGALILEVVRELAGVSEFTVSESDILQGIVLDAAERDFLAGK